MPAYLLRDIAPDLWARVKMRAQQDGMPIRSVILKLLELYANGTVRIAAIRADETRAS